MTRIFFGLLIVFLGIGALTGVNFLKYFFAIFLILLGVAIVVGRGRKFNSWSQKVSSTESNLNDVAIFSPYFKTIKSSNFTGGKIVLVFSGGDIDLRGTKTQNKTIDLELVMVFGGAKLIVPKNWKVNLQGTAILGGYDNKTEHGKEVTLNISGVAVLGGLEIVK